MNPAPDARNFMSPPRPLAGEQKTRYDAREFCAAAWFFPAGFGCDGSRKRRTGVAPNVAPKSQQKQPVRTQVRRCDEKCALHVCAHARARAHGNIYIFRRTVAVELYTIENKGKLVRQIGATVRKCTVAPSHFAANPLKSLNKGVFYG